MLAQEGGDFKVIHAATRQGVHLGSGLRAVGVQDARAVDGNCAFVGRGRVGVRFFFPGALLRVYAFFVQWWFFVVRLSLGECHRFDGLLFGCRYFFGAVFPGGCPLLCGVFFPVTQLPSALQGVSQVLPLHHAIALTRPLVRGEVPDAVLLHVLVLLAYAAVAFWLALAFTRRRLLN